MGSEDLQEMLRSVLVSLRARPTTLERKTKLTVPCLPPSQELSPPCPTCQPPNTCSVVEIPVEEKPSAKESDRPQEVAKGEEERRGDE